VKLGINSVFLLDFDFEGALRFAQQLGAEAIEMGFMGEPTRKFCDADKLLSDKGELRRWLDLLKKYGLEVSALCAHGQPLSPNKQVAEAYSLQFRKACKFAEAAGIDRLVILAGLPEGAPGDSCPCWVVDSFQTFARDALRWQWEKRLIPHWREHAKIAQDHGCKLCFEPQFGDLVHSPSTLMKLREAIGPVVGCNLDPSHFFVQQIDVMEAIRFLGDAIYHVHIKDVRFDPHNMRLKGLLDTTSYREPQNRAWTFTIVGGGHDQTFWREFITNLRLVGYEGALSVEMEAEHVNGTEGVEKAMSFLQPLVLSKLPDTRWWANLGMEL
jgi:sugar phosphate isomerase/epimerase